MSFRRTVLDTRYIFEYDVGLWTFGTIQVLREGKTNDLKVCKTVQKNLIRNPVEAMVKLNRILDMQHKHICGITDVLEDSQRIYVVTDKCAGGDVAEWIVRVQEEGNWLQEATCAEYIRQTLIALVHVHGSRVCHRDLRPSSLALTSKLPDAKVKVCDCGLAEIFDPQNEIRRDLSPFAAPELLDLTNSERHHAAGSSPGALSCAAPGAAADVWSVGAIAHQLLVGSAPPRLEDDHTFLATLARVGSQALSGTSADDVWADRSPLSRDFVRQLLRPLPGSRPSVAVALQHPWMQACVPLDPVHWTRGEGVTELQNMLLCYMLAVLLLPDVLQHRDVFQLRSAFASADVDRDGFISRAAAQRLMRDRLSNSSAADIAGFFDATDVYSTGAVDLCAFLAAYIVGTKLGSVAGESKAQKTAAVAQRLVPLFFESYGDPQRMVASVTSINMKLCSSVVREVEQHAGVHYDELLMGFPEDMPFNAEVLMSTVLENMGRGTPLAPIDSDTERDDGDEAWSERFGLGGVQDLVKGVFQTCALSTEKKRGYRKFMARLGGM